MKNKILINLAYASIALTVIGQCVVGGNFYVGQFAYLLANAVNVGRDFALNRPVADKIKNFTFLGITAGLMILQALRGQREPA